MTSFGPDMPPCADIAPGVRRIVAPNPSIMTGPGTNTYLFGDDEVAVLDPGPAMAEHIENILLKSKGSIQWILVSHTHADHSPGAALLASQTGAQVLGIAAPHGQYQDGTFAPTRELSHGDVLETREFRLEAVHTPGHASNHLCYLHTELNWLFTGDHVIDGSTVVINPPDGNMKQYIRSLQHCKDLKCDALVPGHGEVIGDPVRAIDWIISHRLQREARIVAAIESNPGLTISELVPHVYKDVDRKLYGLAERSLLAHIIKLEEEGIASNRDGRWSL